MPRATPPEVYNLFWYVPPQGNEFPAPQSRHNPNTLSPARSINAIILYPALATPEILVADTDSLEILLLTQKAYSEEKIKRRILEQLKVTKGLDPAKTGFDSDLFPPAYDPSAPSPLTVSAPMTFSNTARLETMKGKFKGFIDERPYDLYTNAGYTTLYQVVLDPKCLEAAGGPSTQPPGRAAEAQDVLMRKGVFDVRHAKLKNEDDGLYYSFPVGNDLDCRSFNTSEPLQSWHPVFVYKDLQYANLAHIADIHLSARQQIMAWSEARVIEYSENGSASDAGASPPIGNMINICSQDVLDIFRQFGSDADFLVIGGDVVDFLQNCFLSQQIYGEVQNGKPTKIWGAVGLAGDPDARAAEDLKTSPFANCVDFVGFYGILLDFCRQNKMPAFLVSGNHDCYWDPYGMSPRVLARQPGDKWYQGSGTGLKRANEGIPADHNLTFYEAILVFGDTYAEIKAPKTKSPPSPFRSDKFDWFYTVFTPFTDYIMELPRQFLVALGWGNDESLFDFPGTGHGFGHLPQATEAISPNQLGLIELAVNKGKKVILMTHFTFVSYKEDIAMTDGVSKPGDVYFDIFKKYEEHNLGTFADNRKPVFETHLGNGRDIQIVLTGHSHRRGLYLIDHVDYTGRNSVKVLHFDFDDFQTAMGVYGQQKDNNGKLKKEPAIIVSDSGATIPRYNKAGEFEGWGSDQPAGTIVTFNQGTGEIDNIQAKRATCQPRIAVALDYVDVFKEHDVITVFETEQFDIKQEQAGTLDRLKFVVSLDQKIHKFGVTIKSLTFYSKPSPNASWRKIETARQDNGNFHIEGCPNVNLFRDVISQVEARGNFVSIKFEPTPPAHVPDALTRYDFETPWCSEFQVDYETFGKILFWAPERKKYKINRNKARAEVPSFDWRREYVQELYA